MRYAVTFNTDGVQTLSPLDETELNVMSGDDL